MDIKKAFGEFISAFGRGKSFLLALSGGADSMTLFALFLESKYPFEVAHVHHGWREESDFEASILKQQCETNKIPFHFKKLQTIPGARNLEKECRELRYAFFQEVMSQKKYEGLVLGHHGDDLAETVLKRVFEGATFPKLKGFGQVSNLEGMTLFRPLIHFRKKEILEYVDKSQISYFQDHTNFDSRFLRGRFRKEVFPYLSTLFGKEIVSSLCRLSDQAHELEDFCESFVSPWRSKIKKDDMSSSLDLGEAHFKSDFEWKLIVKDFFKQEGITLSHKSLSAIVMHLKKKNRSKEMQVGKKKVVIDGRRIKLKLCSSSTIDIIEEE